MKGMLRPKVKVLADAAQIPHDNLLRPPPNQFTHQVVVEQPYYFTDPGRASSPDGSFAAGTAVVLLRNESSSTCRVVDPQGLYVVTARAGLKPLSSRKRQA